MQNFDFSTLEPFPPLDEEERAQQERAEGERAYTIAQLAQKLGKTPNKIRSNI